MINKQLHLSPDEKSTYFTKSKYLNDYSGIFKEEELETE